MSVQEENVPAPKPMRLQRFLAQCGLGSRRDCEELITTGRVTVDGEVADRLGTTVNPLTQTITLDGERLKVERKKYFMLNKPSGYLCTAEDPEGRRLVLDLFPQEGPRLFTVGRLDENTTGLIIVTNDGDLAQKLAHPRYRIFRTYEAQVAGQPKPEVYEQLRQGLFFTEGKFRVHSVTPIKKQKDSTWVEIVMTEGQNREIRRLFARVGHKIMKLERQGYGPLRLGKLKRGEYRELTRDELAALHAVLQRNRAEEGVKPPAAGTRSRTEKKGSSERRSFDRPAGKGRTGSSRFEDKGPRERRGDERPPRERLPRERSPRDRTSGEREFGPKRAERRPGNPRSNEGSRFERSEGGRSERRDFARRADQGKALERRDRGDRARRSDAAGAEPRERRSRADFEGRRDDRGAQGRGKKPAFGERRPSRPSSERPRAGKKKRPPRS